MLNENGLDTSDVEPPPKENDVVGADVDVWVKPNDGFLSASEIGGVLGVAPKPNMDEELDSFFLSPGPDPKPNDMGFAAPLSFAVVGAGPKENGGFGAGSALSAGAVGGPNVNAPLLLPALGAEPKENGDWGVVVVLFEGVPPNDIAGVLGAAGTGLPPKVNVVVAVLGLGAESTASICFAKNPFVFGSVELLGV